MNKVDLSMYLVLDARVCGSRARLLRTAEAALGAGVTILQLRGDKSGWSKRDWFAAAQDLQPLCAAANVPFVINDQVDIALAVNADGVHVGQQDLPVAVVRRLLGADKIVGLSTSTLAEVEAVDTSIVDYIGMGPVFPTTSKTNAPDDLGLDGLRQLVAAKQLPGVAIGGIDVSRVSAVRAVNPDGIAVVAAICAQDDAAAATRALLP